MSYEQRKINPDENRIARREKVADGITRIHWEDGGHTDICVTNEPDGPMDFQGRMFRKSHVVAR